MKPPTKKKVVRKVKKKISLTRSETWLGDSFDSIQKALDEAIESHVGKDEKIVNIQVVKSDNGLSRFWIFTETPNPK